MYRPTIVRYSTESTVRGLYRTDAPTPVVWGSYLPCAVSVSSGCADWLRFRAGGSPRSASGELFPCGWLCLCSCQGSRFQVPGLRVVLVVLLVVAGPTQLELESWGSPGWLGW